MRVGPWEVLPLDTGRFRLDGGAMFGVVPKVLWEKTNPADDRNRIDMALRGMVIRGKDRIFVVDPGIGEKWTPEQVDRFAIDHSRHTLLGALAAAGVVPEAVTDVIVSHLHFDHVGGCTFLGSDGQPTLRFPNATYWVGEKNVSHAHAPTPKDKASFIEGNITPLLSSGRVQLVSDGFEFAPGVSAWVTDGHTPGQVLVKVAGPEGTVFFCGDTIPTSSHVPLPYIMAFDLYPMTTLEEKKRILNRAAQEGWTLFWVHDPFQAAHRVRLDRGRVVLADAAEL